MTDILTGSLPVDPALQVLQAAQDQNQQVPGSSPPSSPPSPADNLAQSQAQQQPQVLPGLDLAGIDAEPAVLLVQVRAAYSGARDRHRPGSGAACQLLVTCTGTEVGPLVITTCSPVLSVKDEHRWVGTFDGIAKDGETYKPRYPVVTGPQFFDDVRRNYPVDEVP